jgi:hypothetical protein
MKEGAWFCLKQEIIWITQFSLSCLPVCAFVVCVCVRERERERERERRMVSKKTTKLFKIMF